jgi:hypothetical protein
MTDQVTCRTCKHNRANWLDRTFNVNAWAWECNLDYKEPEYNPVNGKTTKGRFESCGVVRVKEKICGKAAKAWEPYYKRDILTYLKRI